MFNLFLFFSLTVITFIILVRSKLKNDNVFLLLVKAAICMFFNKITMEISFILFPILVIFSVIVTISAFVVVCIPRDNM